MAVFEFVADRASFYSVCERFYHPTSCTSATLTWSDSAPIPFQPEAFYITAFQDGIRLYFKQPLEGHRERDIWPDYIADESGKLIICGTYDGASLKVEIVL